MVIDIRFALFSNGVLNSSSVLRVRVEFLRIEAHISQFFEIEITDSIHNVS